MKLSASNLLPGGFMGSTSRIGRHNGILRAVFLRQPQRRTAQPSQVGSETLDMFPRAVNLAAALEEALPPLESRDG